MTDKEIMKIVQKVLMATNGLTFFQHITIYGSCLINIINQLHVELKVSPDESFEKLQSAFKEMFDAQFKGIPNENVRIPANETTIEA